MNKQQAQRVVILVGWVQMPVVCGETGTLSHPKRVRLFQEEQCGDNEGEQDALFVIAWFGTAEHSSMKYRLISDSTEESMTSIAFASAGPLFSPRQFLTVNEASNVLQELYNFFFIIH